MILTINNEGAPIIIADLENYKHWSPNSPKSKKITVICKGNMVGFSNHITKGELAGTIKREFNSLKEAEDFEQEVIKEFTKLYPNIQRHPFYKGAPIFYKDDKRIFSIEKNYETYYSKVCKQLDAFGLISFMPKKQGIFIEANGGGPVHIYFNNRDQSFIVFKSLSIMPADKALEIFQSEQEDIKSFTITFNKYIVVTDSALEISSFKNIDGKNQEEKVNAIINEFSSKNILELFDPGCARASGIVFPTIGTEYKCSSRYTEVNKNQSVFGLFFNLVKN